MRGTSIKPCFFIIALLLVFMTMPVHGQNEVKIGVLASRGAEDTLKTWQPTAEYLTKEIPQYSFVIVPLDLDAIAPAVERKGVDFIITNPGNYVELEANYGATRIATMESMYGGRTNKVFGSVIFRRADKNDIRDLKDLKGKSFVGVQEKLFAWQVAWRELKDNGIDPYRDFKELKFSGLPQDLVVYAVREGKADAGAVRTSILESMASEGKINLTDFVVLNQQHDDLPFLHSTRNYPEWAFAKTKHTPDELAEKVVVALLTMPADSAAAKAANAMWTVPLDYQPVHELMKELRTGPYAEYGKITIGEVVQNYWYWIVIAIAAVLFGRAVEMDRRKRAEEAHSMLASIVEFSDDAVIGKTLNGITTSWNPGAEKVYGYSADEVTGKPISILIPPGHFDEMPKILERIKQGETIKHYESVRMRKDSREIDVSLTISPIKDAAGRIIGASTIARDITDRKLMEEQLRAASSYTRNLIEVSLDPLVTISLEGKITDVNTATELVTGVSREQLIGNDFSDYFTEPEKAREGYQQVFDKGFVRDYPLAIRHVSGSITEVLYNASVYKDAAGNVAGVFAAARDITERKRAEDALLRAHDELEFKVEERTSELSSSLKEKEILLKEVHHRVKNNLQIVSSILQLQSTYMKDKQAIVAFGEGRSRVNTMALIHEKLYRSKDLARINFAEYIEELATNLLFFYGINTELIKLKINITDVFFDVNTAIPCGLIINELVTNSLKYAFPGGRKGEVNITLQPIKEKFVLTISDTGAGFPADLDFRNTETLGLKLVISLVNQLDGTIELDRGIGTIFKITFSELKYKERG